MVHLRLNENEPNPNPHINFITALPMPDTHDSEEARQLLRALAAQVRPMMKAHNFTVNKFEEYEYNAVFAGRNWNNGEIIEIVLRHENGSYCPTSWLMSTLCHEVTQLAHIKHMDHGPAFQALWARLRREVRQLQDRGYYGDGYWSSGTRLADSTRISGDGIEAGDFPEYMCGGAQTRARPNAQRRRRHVSRRPQDTTPSLHTGRQTAKRRKAGGRITSKFAFAGVGSSLAGDATSSKGKRAASNRARAERALAAEKRLRAPTPMKDTPASDRDICDEGSGSDSEIEFVQETDAERRQALLDSTKSGSGEDDCNLGKGVLWKDFENEFNFAPPRPESSSTQRDCSDVIELTDDSDTNDDLYDMPSRSGKTFTAGRHASQSNQKKEESRLAPRSSSNVSPAKTSVREKQPGKQVLGSVVRDEIEFRKKEALGLTPGKNRNRKLGQASKVDLPRAEGALLCDSSKSATKPSSPNINRWCCLVCTLENQPKHLACAACATPKGEDTYHIR